MASFLLDRIMRPVLPEFPSYVARMHTDLIAKRPTIRCAGAPRRLQNRTQCLGFQEDAAPWQTAAGLPRQNRAMASKLLS